MSQTMTTLVILAGSIVGVLGLTFGVALVIDFIDYHWS